MSDRSVVQAGGFTLVEIVIAVAIVAMTAAAGFGISLASRSLAVSTAAGEFDQFLDSARTIARDLDGATLAFTPDAYGDGTEVRLLAGGPNAPPSPTTLPVLHARATIEEAESLGKAPFAFVVHANGSLSGRPGFRVGDTATNDVGCPPSGAFHFVIKAAGASADRYVPCRTKLAASGPVTLTTWPSAPTAPSPTPCSGVGCTATSLPSVPPSTAKCPPNFIAAGAGCVPVSAPLGSGARYHVTITGAPATINVGATGSLTAQATLTNANAVPSGTPASIPVGIQSADATCSATPAGWQPSGSTFTITGASAGTCMVTAQADTSSIPGATTDSAALSLTIAATATPTPTATPSPCDLVANGKCYHRIVNQTGQSFYKYVLPDTQCKGSNGDGCGYVDSIKQIILEAAYGFVAPAPPLTSETELLVKVNAIRGATNECEQFSAFANIPGADSIPWSGAVVGAPVIVPIGFGDPSTYVTSHFAIGNTSNGSLFEPDNSWTSGTTLQGMFQAVLQQLVGSPSTATFSSPTASNASYVQWYPDFPGCDVAGDLNFLGREYGITGAVLDFEIYQAQPR